MLISFDKMCNKYVVLNYVEIFTINAATATAVVILGLLLLTRAVCGHWFYVPGCLHVDILKRSTKQSEKCCRAFTN